MSQPQNTPDLIIERDKIFKNDLIMTIGQILFIFTLIAKICANYNGLRTTLLIQMNYDPVEYPNNVINSTPASNQSKSTNNNNEYNS